MVSASLMSVPNNRNTHPEWQRERPYEATATGGVTTLRLGAKSGQSRWGFDEDEKRWFYVWTPSHFWKWLFFASTTDAALASDRRIKRRAEFSL